MNYVKQLNEIVKEKKHSTKDTPVSVQVNTNIVNGVIGGRNTTACSTTRNGQVSNSATIAFSKDNQSTIEKPSKDQSSKLALYNSNGVAFEEECNKPNCQEQTLLGLNTRRASDFN